MSWIILNSSFADVKNFLGGGILISIYIRNGIEIWQNLVVIDPFFL